MFPDFERSLTTKGKNISEQMAQILKEKERDPALFISSPAFRAYQATVCQSYGSTDKIILRRSSRTTLIIP
jgi:phosphohistidine phosphatase SixA